MSDPVAWRILCTNNGATGYLYTEVLPFDPGPGVTVRRDPEPLYAADRIEALKAEVASLREANQTWVDLYGPRALILEHPETDK